MSAIFTCKTGTLFLVALLVPSSLFATAADDVKQIVRWEHAALEADLAGNAAFYEANLADDWTIGHSDGTFETKQSNVSDLRDSKRNITTKESITDPVVRLYGDTAIATYTETYDALQRGKRVIKTIITTDTFIKRRGRWLQVSAHSSTVPTLTGSPVVAP